MRRSFAWFVMVTFLLALAAPAFAQTSAPASSAPASSAPAASAPATKAPAKTEPAKKMATKSATGAVKTASADSLVLVAGKDKKEWTFAVDKDTKIMKAGKAAKAEDLAPDDSATVTYVEADGKMWAKSVSVKAAKAAAAKPKS
jgi:heparin binding hemagglutinin HbhA